MKRTLLALLLSVAMVATTVLTAFPVVFATGDAEDAAPAIDRKGYYFSMDFDEGETGYTPTLGQGASIEDGELTMVPVGTTQTAVFDFPDITLPVTGQNNRKICLSFAFKATSDLNANAYVDLITNGGQGKDKIYLQFSGGRLQAWASGSVAVTVATGLNDNQWHIVEAFYTFKNDTTWEISVSVDGGTPHVMNATKLAASGLTSGIQGQYDVMKTTTVLKSIQTRITDINNPKGSIVFDNFAIGTGSSVNTKDNGNDYYGKYAGTYLDLGFDAEDLAGITAPEGSTLVVENGTMNLSTQKANTTGAHVPYAINIPFDKVNIDITKPFTFSYRLKMSNATASFVQMFTDFTGNNFGQVNANGAVCIPIVSNGAVNAYNKATVHNIKTKGEWHTFDYYVTPLEGGKYSVVVYMNGDEVLRTGDSATFDTAFSNVSFKNSASKFEVKLFASSGYSASQKLDVEFDYFRIGDGTLYEEPHVCEASHEGPFDGMIITDEGHWFNCVDPECDERVDFVAHVEGIPCEDLETGCGWGVEESSDSYTMSISSLVTTGKVGDTVSLAVQLTGGMYESYAAGEVILSYDTSALIFDATASKIGGATAAVTERGLKIEEYGASKMTGGDIYYLYFTVAKAGTYTVAVESAAFSDLDSASTSDLMPAVVENGAVTFVLSEATFAVTLDDIYTGQSSVTAGGDYVFYPADADNYTYEAPVVSVAGVEAIATWDAEKQGWVVTNVTGALTVSGTRVAKSYDVTIGGEAAEDATYGVDYTFTIPNDIPAQGATPGTAYTLGTVTIGGTVFTGLSVLNRTVTIPGSAITGVIVVTFTTSDIEPETVRVDVNYGEGVEEIEFESTSILGVDYTFMITAKGGYLLTVTASVNGGEAFTVSSSHGDWIIPADLMTGDVVITVTTTPDLSSVQVYEYLKLDGTTMWLVTLEHLMLDLEASHYTYDGNAMVVYKDYVAYLVVAESLTLDEAKAKIAIAAGATDELAETYDINGTGTLDANDAQLVYNMYNGNYTEVTDVVTMEKFILADVNGDKKINVEDTAAIVAAVLDAM